MEKFLAKCIANTTVQGINVGKVYCVEHDLNYKIIYNETKKNFESALGNKEWFYEHFEPLRCVCCNDRDYCKVYEDGREYACYGFEEEKERRSSMIQKLEIIQEYKFVKGGSSFYIQIGQKLTVNIEENTIEGILTGVDPDGEYFRLDCGDNAEKVNCDKVIDIIPI